MESDEEDNYTQGTYQQDEGTSSKTFSLDNLPTEFVAFLAKNEIDPAIYTVTDLPRYVRLNPDPHLTITPEELEKQLGTKVEPVPGLEAFCRLDGSAKLRNTQAYKDGRIFGMDLSSGIAVYALDVQPGEHVLDICCAPGAKLCMIAGLLTNSGNVRSDRFGGGNQLQMDITGTVTGVDISPHRLSTCRSLLKRHRLQQCARLFQADGTTFSVLRPSAIDTIRARIMANPSGAKKTAPDPQSSAQSKRALDDDEDEYDDYGNSEISQMVVDGGQESAARQQFHINSLENETTFKRHKVALDTLKGLCSGSTGETTLFNGTETNGSQEKIVPFFAPKILRNDPQLRTEAYKYDKVIVDAECTHDGSIAHILKYEAWGWDSFHKNFMSQDRLDSLSDLQRGLLMNGFRLTKAGGIIVYSTCSLSRAQNEDIVAWFIAGMRGRAVLEPLPKHALGIQTASCKRPCRSIVANALGLPTATNASGQAQWQGTPQQETDMEQFQDHIQEMCLRYDPLASKTSGFFLARIRKIA
ncbi:MAG: S-adenosyl-L-methionine-dependent methyltransferase [Linnemannia gamsii]|nr:MAG: S-adenosyl-L-methionine-dependent methyltransferase [Linnemannia gamsii]